MSELNSKNIKNYNRRQVLSVLRKNLEISVKDITAITGISRTSIARSIQKFIKQGLVHEQGKGESTLEGGKRPILYSLDKKYRVFAICYAQPDLFTTVIADLNGSTLAEVRTKITHESSLQNIVNGIISAIKHLLSQLNISIDRVYGIAVGVPGITNVHTGEFLLAPHCKAMGKNINLKKLLLAEFGINIPCYIDNEVRFQSYAEQRFGFGRQHDNFIVLDVDDGLVAGIINDNKISYGNDCVAGEIGHMLIDPEDDLKCFCGGYGCLENKVSATAAARFYLKFKEQYPEATPIQISPDSGKIDLINLLQEADNINNELARVTVAEIARWFAYGISNLILTINPELIVFHGPYAAGSGYFDQVLKEHLNTRLIANLSLIPRISYSNLGNKSCITGASIFLADLFFNQYT